MHVLALVLLVLVRVVRLLTEVTLVVLLWLLLVVVLALLGQHHDQLAVHGLASRRRLARLGNFSRRSDAFNLISHSLVDCSN